MAALQRGAGNRAAAALSRRAHAQRLAVQRKDARQEALDEAERLAASVAGPLTGSAAEPTFADRVREAEEQRQAKYGDKYKDPSMWAGGSATDDLTSPAPSEVAEAAPEGEAASPPAAGGGAGGAPSRGSGGGKSPGAVPAAGTAEHPPVDAGEALGPVQNPDVDLAFDPEMRGSFKVPIGGQLKPSHVLTKEFKPPKDLRYLECHKVWVQFQGSATVAGDVATVGGTPWKGESKGGKTKNTPLGYVDVPIPSFTGKVAGGSLDIATKATLEATAEKRQASISVALTWGKLTGEVKVILVGQDLTTGEVTGVMIQPGAGVTISETFNLSGVPVKLNGKILFGGDFKPIWSRIFPKLAELLGTGAAAEGTATAAAGAAAGAAESIPTGMAAVGAGELILVGGFLAGAAATVFAVYKSAQEVGEMKDLGKMAEAATGDFVDGYCAAFGVGSGGTTDMAKKGLETGRSKIDVHVARAEGFLRLNHPAMDVTDADREEFRRTFKERVQNDPGFRDQALRCFRRWIHGQVYLTWRDLAAKDERWRLKQQDAHVKTYLLGGEDPPAQPNWSAFATGERQAR